MRARGSAAARLLVAATASIVLVSLTGVGPSHGGDRPERSAPGWLVFSRFDPTIDDDATFVRQADGTGIGPLEASSAPHWSPDGDLVAIGACADPPDCNTAAVLVDPATRDFTALPMPEPDRLFTGCLTWTPNGRRLACEGFGVDRAKPNGVYTIRASDGQDLRRSTWNPGDDDNPADFSPNGTRLLFTRTESHRPEDSNSALFVKNLRRDAIHRITPWGFSDAEATGHRAAGELPSSTTAGSTTRSRTATRCARSGSRLSRATGQETSPGRRTAGASSSSCSRRSRAAPTEKGFRPHEPTAPTSGGSPQVRHRSPTGLASLRIDMGHAEW